MSPMSPSFMSGGQSNWPQSDWPEVQIPDLREKCPICGNVLTELFGDIGGFPGHELIHPGSLVGYNCYECMRYFSLGEILLIKEKKARKEALVRNYWQGVCTSFKNPYLYLVVVCFMVLHKSFWKGIVAGIVISFSLPLLMNGLEKTFAPLIKLVRKKFESPPSNKPPDSPPTP